MLSGAVRPGRSPIRTTTQSALQRGGDGVADRDPAVAHDHQRRDPPAFGAQRRQHVGQHRRGMRLHGARPTGRRLMTNAMS